MMGYRNSTLLMWLTISLLIIGPLCVGSYFDQFRYPLLLLSWLAVAYSLITPSLYAHPPKILLILTISLALLGFWMTWNSEGIFTRSPWWIQPRDDQPFKNLPGAADMAQAWDKMLYIIPCLVIIPMTCYLVRTNRKFTKYIALTIYGVGLIISFLGIIQYIYEIETIWGVYTPRNKLFFGTFRSPGIASCYLNVSLAMGLGNLLAHKSDEIKIGSIVSKILGCGLIFFGIILTSSKAGIALAGFTIALWGILNFRAIKRNFTESTNTIFKGKKFDRNLCLGVVMTIIASGTLALSSKTSGRIAWAIKSNNRTWTSRTNAFDAQFEMLADPAWLPLGYGPGSFMPYFRFFAPPNPDTPSGVWVYAHNDYLQTLIEWGPFGFLFFAILICGALWILTKIHFQKERNFSRKRVTLLRSYLVAMITMLLHAIVDFPFQIESIAITFAVIAGIAWGHYEPSSREPSPTKN